MNSIGPHFYALAPAIQAIRIEEFASQILTHNQGLPLNFVAHCLQGALKSMGSKKATPKVRAVGNALEISGRGFTLIVSRNFAHTRIGELSAPARGVAGYWDGPIDGPGLHDE